MKPFRNDFLILFRFNGIAIIIKNTLKYISYWQQLQFLNIFTRKQAKTQKRRRNKSIDGEKFYIRYGQIKPISMGPNEKKSMQKMYRSRKYSNK